MKTIVGLLLVFFAMPSMAESAAWLAFHRYGDEIENRDPTPRLRIFSNGRMLVYRPVYELKPGLYETWLDTDQLRSLQTRLSDPKLQDFDPERVAIEIEANASKQKELIWTSESSITQVIIRPGKKGPGLSILTWRNLQTEAQRFDSSSLTALAALERRLLELSRDDRLKQIAPATVDQQ